MLPYFFLLALPTLFVLTHRRVAKEIFFLVFFIFVTFVGFRYEVGPDWYPYIRLHLHSSDLSLEEIWQNSEPLSYSLFWFSQNFTGGTVLTNVVAATILLYGIFSYARTTTNPWLAVIAATPYLIIVFGMSGIRQAMAVGISLYVLSRWSEHGIVRRCILIFIATLFHNSALFMATLVLVCWPGLSGTKRWIASASAILVFVVLVLFLPEEADLYSDQLDDYQRRYLDPDARISPGALMIVPLVAIPGLIGIFFREKFKKIVNNYDVFMFGSVVALILFSIVFAYSNAARRLSLYLYFVPMLVWAGIPFLFGNKNRKILTFGIVIVHFIILLFWLGFGNQRGAFLPYGNIIFLQLFQ